MMMQLKMKMMQYVYVRYYKKEDSIFAPVFVLVSVGLVAVVTAIKLDFLYYYKLSQFLYSD